MGSAKSVGICTTITTYLRNIAAECVVKLCTKIVMHRLTSSRRIFNVTSASKIPIKHINVFYVALRMEF